ncbi:alpha-N-acetylglucosaminidase [Carboxylicivirga mesophila]|uniref:Alpha-N-acetylglucosaminidase n=1 Tax=Carboxylicivirga mesophila TaxID=1166478 RepID=A0ABS5KCR6_9BACT|nr:alpha-N-acetylglucosaminidase [Carboxylicivirga mesophila]MBS2212667.1 alpha-N-acetylglucosaminidase [Carboxylicivirga mesophila]
MKCISFINVSGAFIKAGFRRFKYIPVLGLLFIFLCSFSSPNEPNSVLAAANNLIERVIPGYATQFHLEVIDSENGKDVFEIDTVNNTIVLRGNNQVAIASALHWYLKYTCNVHVSWCGTQMNLAQKLPLPTHKQRKIIDAEYRVHFNYCTFNYSASWWDWERWQWEIDYLAMNGVNMPLAIVGLEGVWYNTLLKFGFDDEEVRSFLAGPAYLAWQWMTNIQSHGGPLPNSWIEAHIELGKKIIDRYHELGMKPVQQGFTGYVPRAFMDKYPDAKILQEYEWCGIEGTAQLDPLDPLFKEFGKAFMQEQKKLFGAYGVYAADPFHEGHPPKNTKKYMNEVGRAINDLMTECDPDALWVMQAWTIREDIATVLPKDRLLILDLNGERWSELNNFWGYNFVVGNLHNFGGRINMHGDLKLLVSNQYQQSKTAAPNAVGSGLFMEAIFQNPVYYDLAFEMSFHDGAIDLNDWLLNYTTRRYGASSINAAKAWQLLLDGPYKPGTNGVENSSIIAARPSLTHKKSGPNAGLDIPYNPKNVIQALELLLSESGNIKQSDGYRFDLVDLQRQVLSNLAQEIDKKITEAYFNKDLQAFRKHSACFLELLVDVDRVVSTRDEYNFGKWVADARKWGRTAEEGDLYEYNASLLVTQWGGTIFDYSWREWGGLIKGYYMPRWLKYFEMLEQHLEQGDEYNEKDLPTTHGRIALRANGFYAALDDWEKAWIKSRKEMPLGHQEDEIEIVESIFNKYRLLLEEYY